MYNCSSIDEKILCICKNKYQCFLSKPNVIGIGLGYKFTKGFYTNKKCIVVLVTKKISSINLGINDLVPKTFNGVLTDVVESGPFYLSSLTTRVRPVTGGYSIGLSAYPTAGTMGCVVTDGKKHFVLSSGHVLTNDGKFVEDSPIIQPSVVDGGRFTADRIALLKKVVPIYPMTPSHPPLNKVDCGIAEAFTKTTLSPKITFLGDIHGVTAPKLREDVQKVGKTTELTKGVIQSIGMTMAMTIGSNKYLFQNQIITSSMSTAGDSGSVLLDKHLNAVGLLMGSMTGISVFNTMTDVLSSLNVTIVTK